MGLAMAKYLAGLKVASVVLMSRNGVLARDEQLLQELPPSIVRVVKGDVTDFDSFSKIAMALVPPVMHVINLAMILNDKYMRSVTAEDVIKIGSPKIVGTWNLHRLEALLPANTKPSGPCPRRQLWLGLQGNMFTAARMRLWMELQNTAPPEVLQASPSNLAL